MSELSFEELLNAQETVRIHTGKIITGSVIDVKENEIILNIGYKTDGVCKKAEYSNDQNVNLQDAVQVGDEMEVKVLRLNDGEGQVELSYKRVIQEKGIKELEDAFEAQTPLTGTVISDVKGGLSVDCMGAHVFIPASLVTDYFERNLKKYVGQEVEFVLTEYDPKKRRVIGDCKKLIVEKKEATKAALLERIAVGQIVTGKIKNLTQFGAFVDLDGGDGLLHVSEMSWGHIRNPKQLYKPGDEVEAFVKEISEDGKIALSVKFPNDNPWTEDGPYSEGNVLTGKVVRMTDSAAFVELQQGIDAYLHVSQIAHEHVAKPGDALKIGQEIEAKVVKYSPEEGRINISIKELLPAPAPKAEEPAEEPVEEPVEAPVEEAPVEEAPAEEPVEAPAE